jgi:hypothetical protein
MVINDIDLEKENFLIDLERNIFLIPAEILEQYRLSPDRHEESELDSLFVPPSVIEETPKKYEHKTVFVLNCKAIYEIPCKIASERILSKHKRDYFTHYMYLRKWVDIDPAEIPIVSLFLYDLTEIMRENKKKSHTTACDSVNYRKINWLHRPFSGLRTSVFSRSEEKKKAFNAQKYLTDKIHKPVNTIVQDLAEKGKDERGFFDDFDEFLREIPPHVSKNVFFLDNLYDVSSYATHVGCIIDLREEFLAKYGVLSDSESE